MTFTDELIKTIDEGLEIILRKGFFRHTLVLRISDHSAEPSRHVTREIELTTCDDDILIGNLKHAKLQLLRKGGQSG